MRSFLVRSNLSAMILNETRQTRPSSKRKAMCAGPKHIRLTLGRSEERTG